MGHDPAVEVVHVLDDGGVVEAAPGVDVGLDGDVQAFEGWQAGGDAVEGMWEMGYVQGPVAVTSKGVSF